MSLVDALLSRGDPETRAITPAQLAWDRGIDNSNNFIPAGVEVDRDTMLGLSAVWACVSLISDSIATLPLKTVKTTGDGPPKPAKCPSWLEDPNPEQTLVDFKFGTVASLLLHGNAYIYTVRDPKMNILEAWILDPRWCYVRREYDENGQLALFYYVMVGKGMQSPVGPFRVKAGPEMFHIMAFQPNSSWPMGISPVDNARMLWGSAIAGQEMGTRFFSQGMNASGVIEVDDDFTLEQAKQLKQDFKDANTGGPRKMHYPPVLTGGAAWKQIQISPEQAQFLEQRQFAIDEIARWFRVPPHMIGNLEKTTSWGSGIEEQSIGFVKYTLRPWLERIEESWTRNFLTFQPNTRFRFETKALERGNMANQADYFLKLHGMGAITANQAAAELGFPPFDGGDVHYFMVNTAPVGTEPEMINKPKVDIPGALEPAESLTPTTPTPGGEQPGQEQNSFVVPLELRVNPEINVDPPQVTVEPQVTIEVDTDRLGDHVAAAITRLDDQRNERDAANQAELRQNQQELRQLLEAHGVKNEKQMKSLRAELTKPAKPALRKVTLPDGKTALILQDGAERLLEFPDGRRISISTLNGD